MKLSVVDVERRLRECFDAASATVPSRGDAELSGSIAEYLMQDYESAPLAPADAVEESPRQRVGRSITPKGHKWIFAIAGLAAVVLLLAEIIPIVGGSHSSAAAADLQEAAAAALQQTYPVPTAGQALDASFQFAIDAYETGADGSVASSATFEGSLREAALSNGNGQATISYGPPQFASVAAQKAWRPNPGVPFWHGNIAFSATKGPILVGLGASVGAYDVTTIPTTATALGKFLSQSATGVKGLDDVPDTKDRTLVRTGLLLSSLLLGGSSQLEYALYVVLSQLPGIESLGPRAAHSGLLGTAFTQPGSGVVFIINTKTGQLLEMRRSPVSAPDNPGSSENPILGGSTLLWVDPSELGVVPASSVPPT